MIINLNRSPDPNVMSSDIPKEELPRCEIKDCGALLRPDIIWFGEQLNEDILQKACTYKIFFNKYISYKSFCLYIEHAYVKTWNKSFNI